MLIFFSTVFARSRNVAGCRKNVMSIRTHADPITLLLSKFTNNHSKTLTGNEDIELSALSASAKEAKKLDFDCR